MREAPLLLHHKTPARNVLVNPFIFNQAAGLTFVASVSATGLSSGPVTTGIINTTSVKLLIAAMYYVTGATSVAVTDSKSNIWIPLSARGTTFLARLFYCANPTVGSGHTFTASGSNIFSGIAVMAFSDANSSSYDTDTGANSTQPGSISPAGNNELFAVAWGRNDTNALTINSGFTIVEATAYSAGAGLRLGLAYFLQGTGSALNPTTNSDGGTAMAAFKP